MCVIFLSLGNGVLFVLARVERVACLRGWCASVGWVGGVLAWVAWIVSWLGLCASIGGVLAYVA